MQKVYRPAQFCAGRFVNFDEIPIFLLCRKLAQELIQRNKLFQIFNEKVKTVTGYTPYLDWSWFNEANPYWKDLVYMLQPLASESGNNIKNSYIYNMANKEVSWSSSGSSFNYGVYKNITPLPSGSSSEGVSRMDFSTGYIDLELNDVIRFENLNFEFCVLGR
jgi:hypothetical protein